VSAEVLAARHAMTLVRSGGAFHWRVAALSRHDRNAKSLRRRGTATRKHLDTALRNAGRANAAAAASRTDNPRRRGSRAMAEPQLSVRSARARDLAHRLAEREQRTVAEVVERALLAYEAEQEPADSFYARISRDCGTDIDLEAVIREHRRAHMGIEL